MSLVAAFVQLCLWLSIALSPTLLGAILASIISYQLGEFSPGYLAFGCVVGGIIGTLWAERIRRTVGLSQFLGRLLGTPDIDGPSKA